jgi:hypothetical protein
MRTKPPKSRDRSRRPERFAEEYAFVVPVEAREPLRAVPIIRSQAELESRAERVAGERGENHEAGEREDQAASKRASAVEKGRPKLGRFRRETARPGKDPRDENHRERTRRAGERGARRRNGKNRNKPEETPRAVAPGPRDRERTRAAAAPAEARICSAEEGRPSRMRRADGRAPRERVRRRLRERTCPIESGPRSEPVAPPVAVSRE